MAFIALSQGMKFKGELILIGDNYDYELDIIKIKSNDEFEFDHSVYINEELIDNKRGSGNFKKIDENIVKIIFNDEETLFEGDLNVNTFEILGNAKQKDGSYNDHPGPFTLKLVQ